MSHDSINVNVAFARAMTALETEEFFRARAKNSCRRAFLEFLETGSGDPPRRGDELPTPTRTEPAHSGGDAE